MTVSAKSIATAVMAVAFSPPCAGAWTGGGDYWTAGVDCATDLSLGTALIQSERFGLAEREELESNILRVVEN